MSKALDSLIAAVGGTQVALALFERVDARTCATWIAPDASVAVARLLFFSGMICAGGRRRMRAFSQGEQGRLGLCCAVLGRHTRCRNAILGRRD